MELPEPKSAVHGRQLARGCFGGQTRQEDRVSWVPAGCVLSDLEFSDCLQQTLTARGKTLELTESVRPSSTHQVANGQNTAQQHFFFVVIYVVPSNFSDLLLLN